MFHYFKHIQCNKQASPEILEAIESICEKCGLDITKLSGCILMGGKIHQIRSTSFCGV